MQQICASIELRVWVKTDSILCTYLNGMNSPLCKRAGSKHPRVLANYIHITHPIVAELLDAVLTNHKILDVHIAHYAINTTTHKHTVYVYYDIGGSPYYTYHIMIIGQHTPVCEFRYSMDYAPRPVCNNELCKRLQPLCMRNKFAILDDDE